MEKKQQQPGETVNRLNELLAKTTLSVSETKEIQQIVLYDVPASPSPPAGVNVASLPTKQRLWREQQREEHREEQQRQKDIDAEEERRQQPEPARVEFGCPNPMCFCKECTCGEFCTCGVSAAVTDAAPCGRTLSDGLLLSQPCWLNATE